MEVPRPVCHPWLSIEADIIAIGYGSDDAANINPGVPGGGTASRRFCLLPDSARTLSIVSEEVFVGDWWALVGPIGGPEPAGYLTTPHDAFRCLRGPVQVGPLTLRPGDRQRVEFFPRLDLGFIESVWWPIIVTGDAAEGSDRLISDRQPATSTGSPACSAWHGSNVVTVAADRGPGPFALRRYRRPVAMGW